MRCAAQVAIVTGANTGLGQESTLRLWQAGCRVVMMCRSPAKCEAARQAILQHSGGDGSALVVSPAMDLASIASVATAAVWFRAQKLPLHILMLNAGLLSPHKLTPDGIETSFQVNHLGHFLLEQLLEDILIASAPARVVVVSSDAHFYGYPEGIRGDLASINDPEGATSFLNYGQAKLCNVLFSNALSRRISGRGVQVNAIHPGGVASDFARNGLLAAGFSESVADGIHTIMTKGLVYTGFVFDVEGGALTQLYAAMSPDIEAQNVTGKYFVPIALALPSHPHADNITMQDQLWALSEKLVHQA